MRRVWVWATNLSTVWQILIIFALAAFIGAGSSFAINSGSPNKPTAKKPKVAGASITKYPKTDEAGNILGEDEDIDTTESEDEEISPNTTNTVTPPPPAPVAIPPPPAQNTITGYSYQCVLNEDGETYSAYKIAHWSNGTTENLGIDSSYTDCPV